MAEEQKPVEVPQEETLAAPVEIKPIEVTPAAVAAPAEDKPAEETKVDAEETVDAADAKDKVTPVEEGQLSHKAQGLSFPKNLIPSKEFFFFGSEAMEPRSLGSYRRAEKSADVAQSNMAWASHTGKGLLFVGDKRAPSGVINLSDASEPEVDGTNKFHLTSKGNKHSFKAASTAERDNWVSQLKLKIAEAKELAASVAESETYKKTLESFKPAVAAKKEEKPAEVAEETAATEEPAKADEAAKEEPKVDDTKARSTSRKRASIFGFGGKKEEKKEEAKAPAETTEPAAEPEVVAAAVVPEVAAAPAEDKAVEESKPAETPKDKSAKRNSFFGGWNKKDKKPVETKAEEPTEAAKEETVAPAAEGITTDEVAPVIPPVETQTPLTADVSSPANVPTEVKDVTATNGDKKDVKEKRKSSLPFNFGAKREKTPAPAETDDKAAKASPFSKLRATINRKSTPKADEKATEETKEETKEETAEEAPAAAPEEPIAVPAEPEVGNAPENVAATAPVVTATA